MIIRFPGLVTYGPPGEMPAGVATWLLPVRMAMDRIDRDAYAEPVMGGAADLAAALERIKAAVDSKSGEVCIKAMAPVALRYLQQATPVLTGRLRGSERVDSISASGRHGEAFIAPHTVYARFRNDGGTIHVKRAKVLSNGVSFFGKQRHPGG